MHWGGPIGNMEWARLEWRDVREIEIKACPDREGITTILKALFAEDCRNVSRRWATADLAHGPIVAIGVLAHAVSAGIWSGALLAARSARSGPRSSENVCGSKHEEGV